MALLGECDRLAQGRTFTTLVSFCGRVTADEIFDQRNENGFER